MAKFPIFITNSMTQNKGLFVPIDSNNVKMYVCGPTVYDRPHLGNVRSVVIYDILFRLLLYIYDRKVTYVRNITDIDDKIINISKKLNLTPALVASKVEAQYHEDIKALNCLEPTIEPRATEHLLDIFSMIQSLIDKGHAYIDQGHVLFSTATYNEYGNLSKRSIDELIAGSRIDIASYKRNPTDFVLWKPYKDGEEYCSFQSPWGLGRPGWHIECSAMSKRHLGQDFDIHGGGVDLIFPHHENEIAQSICANSNSVFAKYWVHNGHLSFDGEKMSKSLGNVRTARDVLDSGISGSVLRYFYLSAHYHKPLEYTDKAIENAQKSLERFTKFILQYYPPDQLLNKGFVESIRDSYITEKDTILKDNVIKLLCDDINTPTVLAKLHSLLHNHSRESAELLIACCDFIGFDIAEMMQSHINSYNIPETIEKLAIARNEAKKNKDWNKADMIRLEIKELGYNITDTIDGYKLQKRIQ